VSQRGFCNNASIARDGTIYFTDSSSRFPLSAWRRDILEHRPNGRLLAYRDGTYWIAMPSPRLPIVESLLPHPLLRKLADLLPQWMQPQPERYGLVALVDAQGRVLRTLHGPSGSFSMITRGTPTGAVALVRQSHRERRRPGHPLLRTVPSLVLIMSLLVA
jgi:Strictosidine synthase